MGCDGARGKAVVDEPGRWWHQPIALDVKESRRLLARPVAGQQLARQAGVKEEELAPLVHDPRTLCFVCGPQALVDEMPGLLQSLGVPRERVLEALAELRRNLRQFEVRFGAVRRERDRCLQIELSPLEARL